MAGINILNKIIFGTANFQKNYGIRTRKEFNLAEIKIIIRLIKKNKIKNVDTAINYKNVEAKLGKCKINNFNVFTKLPKIPSNIGEKKVFNKVNKYVKKSKQNLKIDKFEGIYLHNPSDLLNSNGKFIYKALKKLKEKKIINKVGISVYSKTLLKKIIKRFKIDMVQLPINIFDRRFLEKSLIRNLRKRRIEIHARSIFLQGLILKRANQLPDNFFKWRNFFQSWYNWNHKNNQSLLETSISFILKQKRIDKIVLGFSNKEQFLKILKVLKINKKNKYPQNIFSTNKKLIDPRLW